MPAKSKSQQRLFGMVHACQKYGKCASGEVSKIAGSISAKDAEEFASTKHDGLPERKMKKKHKKKNKLKGFREFRQEQIMETALSSQERNLASLQLGDLGEVGDIMKQASIPVNYYFSIMKKCIRKIEQQLQQAGVGGPQAGAEEGGNTHQLALKILNVLLDKAASGRMGGTNTARGLARGIQQGMARSAATAPAPAAPTSAPAPGGDANGGVQL